MSFTFMTIIILTNICSSETSFTRGDIFLFLFLSAPHLVKYNTVTVTVSFVISREIKVVLLFLLVKQLVFF